MLILRTRGGVGFAQDRKCDECNSNIIDIRLEIKLQV